VPTAAVFARADDASSDADSYDATVDSETYDREFRNC